MVGKRQRAMRRALRANGALLLYVSPALLFMLVFIVVPLVAGVQYSLLKWNGISITKTYIGLRNYVASFEDDKFIKSISFTLIYTGINLVLVNVFALLLASILSRKLKTGGFLRTLFFSPNVISLVVIGMIWLFIFSTVFSTLARTTGLTFLNVNWFGDALYARLALIIVTQWITSGYLMIIYIAGIKSIDVEIIEASIIDGSRGLGRFFRITLPLLMPSVVISVFWITIYSLKIFDLPFVITAGGPYNSTETIPVNIWYSAFSYSRYGYASAKSIILLLIIVLITFLEVFYLKRREIGAMKKAAGEALLVILGLLFIYPLVLVLMNSFKSYGEIYNSPLSFPATFRIENYVFVWNDMKYLSKVVNSLLVTACPIPFVVFFGSLAAYKLVRTKTILASALFYLFISTMLIPLNVIMVPLLIMARTFKMLDRLLSLVLIYIALSTPFAIFLYHGFIKNIKTDIEEAARIDGCGSFRIYLNIVFPMLKPITTTIIILLVLGFWNDFFLPLLLISKDPLKTLPLVAYKYHGQFMKEWSKILPAVVLLSIPVFIFFFIFQKYILEGIAQGAVKG